MSDTDGPAPNSAGALHEHFCEHEGCKAWGSHGYDVDRVTKWFCYQHRWKDYRSSMSAFGSGPEHCVVAPVLSSGSRGGNTLPTTSSLMLEIRAIREKSPTSPALAGLSFVRDPS